MQRSTRWLRVPAAIMVLTLLVAACGDGSMTTVSNSAPVVGASTAEPDSLTAPIGSEASAGPSSDEAAVEQIAAVTEPTAAGVAPIVMAAEPTVGESSPAEEPDVLPTPLPTVGPTPAPPCIIGFALSPDGMCFRTVPAIQPADTVGCLAGYALSEDQSVCTGQGVFVGAVLECPDGLPRMVEGNCYGPIVCPDGSAPAGSARCFETTSAPAIQVAAATCDGAPTQLLADGCVRFVPPALLTPPLSCPQPAIPETVATAITADGQCVETMPRNP